MTDFDRYARQIQASPHGVAGQQKIAAARVVIVGMGGLGGTLALQLAGAGVGQLILIDYDQVALNNLHRQWIFNEGDVGASKALVAKEKLTQLNSQITITAHHTRLNTQNAQVLIQAADIVIDAADNFLTSYLLNEACTVSNIALLSASVNQRFGYLGIFGGSAASLRAVFPRVPKNQQSCDTVGVTGPAVGVVASLQAQLALDYLHAGAGDAKVGKLLYVDLTNYSLHQVDFSTAAEPSTAAIGLIAGQEITATDFVIDVRSELETQQQPQPFSVDLHLPLQRMQDDTYDLPTNRRLVCACQSGERALAAAQQLVEAGYENVVVVVPD